MTAAREAMGESKTRLYNIWLHMRRRCANQSDPAFDRYGGRGIHVCAEWNASFKAFRAWALANGYTAKLTIDRINNDGDYEPANCRWATYAEQNRNYSRNRPVEFDGRQWLVCDLAIAHGLPQDVVKNRIFRYGWSVEEAVRAPVAKRNGQPRWLREGATSSTTYYRKRAAISFKRVQP